ncbi:Glucosyltransferase-like protein [Arachnomyces sp. PD_36]|nr:Glucosyltransferase-like protein [Arachnomyces sp. PD_36]
MASSPASTPSSRRARKKRKVLSTGSPSSNADLVVLDNNTGLAKPAFPLVAFLWPARAGTSQWLILPSILMAVGLFRWGASLWGYSGFNVPPMHGDFEAQRHWMEITTHLPISKWYFYDLQWWGLDYPPLTAYHSWLLGIIGSLINPSWFALDESRALEEPLLKVFMRATVVVSEYLVYIPAVVILTRRYTRAQGVHVWAASIALVAILMQPATILVDHGHFQYNTVMLGLVVASLESLLAGRNLWACVFFVGALGFKQMALYYAPTIFAFLLGVCVFPRIRIGRLLGISLITLVAFAIVFAPIIVGAIYDKYRNIPLSQPAPASFEPLLSKLDTNSWLYAVALQLSQSVHRIFPFSRGLFEDKVANLWCAVHTFYKLHRFPSELLQRLSLYATLLSILPSCAIIGRFPRRSLLPLALSSTAWGFFLCSFQVHEKSVLLPLLPMTLLLASDTGLSKETRAWVGWANILGTWTLFPLLKRDELRVPYYIFTLLWAYLLGLPPVSLEVYRRSRTNEGGEATPVHIVVTLLHISFYVAMVGWHVLEAFVPPPPTKPDLWVVLNVLIGAAGFGIAYLWCTWKLVQQSGLFNSSSQSSGDDTGIQQKKKQ